MNAPEANNHLAEDRRAASNLVISLSSYVMSAGLAVLGAQAVVATFVVDKRDDLDVFYVVSVAATTCLVLSIIIGGRGMYEIIGKGAKGDWRIRTERGHFNKQALLVLVGTIFVVLSAFLGHTKAVH
jgi:hypothetical protein